VVVLFLDIEKDTERMKAEKLAGRR
jgi:hypothetical protein